MDKIRILLADDHTILRKGLYALLSKEKDLDVVGEAENGRETLEKVSQLMPDIIVMDISMPELNGLETTRQLKKKFPDIKIIILTIHTNEEYVLKALRYGASGYLVKKAAPEDLITAIREINMGKSFLSPSVSKTVINEYVRQAESMINGRVQEINLSIRESEILQMIAEGYKNREIAQNLFLSIKTIETHRSKLKEKLNLNSTAELIQYAIRQGLISAEI